MTPPRVDALTAKDASAKLWLAVTNIDPNRPGEIVASVAGLAAKAAAGTTLTASKVDAVSTFDAPATVEPKLFAAAVQGGRVTLRVAPKSVTVVSVGP